MERRRGSWRGEGEREVGKRERERERQGVGERESYRLILGPVIPTAVRDVGWVGGTLAPYPICRDCEPRPGRMRR